MATLIYDLADLQAMENDLAADYELANDIDASGAPFTPLGAMNLSQTKRPTSDYSSSGSWTIYPASPTTKYDKVDEETADDDSTYIQAIADSSRVLFGFPTPSIPSDAIIISVRVVRRVKLVSVGTAYEAACVRVNGVNYDKEAHDRTNTNWYNVYSTFATNPATGEAWTVDDINGVGDNPLEKFGILVSDATPNLRYTQFYLNIHYDRPISGTLDGKGYSVNELNFALSGAASQYGALTIGCIGTIKNITFADVSLSANSTSHNVYLAALVLWNEGGTIQNCNVAGAITATALNSIFMGGLMLDNDMGGSMKNCHNWATITGTSTNGGVFVGGLVMSNDESTIEDCGNASSVTLEVSSGTGSIFVGGICYRNDGGTIRRTSNSGNVSAITTSGGIFISGGVADNESDGLIEACFNIGTVNATSSSGNVYAGGFSYDNDDAESVINDSYNAASITVSGATAYVGGFVRSNDGSINRCFHTGLITAITSVAGFCKYNDGIIVDSFWDMETSGQSTSDGGIGKTTAEMKNIATFSPWAIAPYPILLNNGYPFLGWQVGLGTTWLIYGAITRRIVDTQDVVTLQAIRNIEMAAKSRFFIDEEGRAIYNSRMARQL